MTAVFVAHTKVLTAVRLSAKQKKLSITVPKLDHFIHRIFKESARCFWKSPFLFMSDGGVVERQKNVLQVEALATEAITTAIRGLLPVKQILQDYLGDDADEVVEETKEEEEKPVIKEEVVPALPVKEVVKEEVNEVVKEEVKDVVKEEVKEEVKEVVKEEATASPSVIKIDTEPAVHFSDYDAVFDETKGAPEMLFNPKDGDDEDISSDALTIHDGPDTPLTAEDAEDLDAPVPPVPAPVVKKDTIDDSDVVVLE